MDDNTQIKEELGAEDGLIPETDTDIDDFANEEKLKAAEAEILAEMSRKKKKTAAGIFIGLITLIVLVGSVGFGIHTFVEAQSKRYVMEFADEKISAEELKLFMIFSGGDTDSAMSMLTDYLLYKYAAEKFGVVLNDDNKQDVIDYIESIKQGITDYGYEQPKISDERYMEILSVEFMVDDIVDAVTADYLPSESEFEEFMALYSEDIKVYYSNINVKYIITESEETANDARNALEQGAEPDEAIKEFSAYYSEDVGIETVALSNLGLDSETASGIMALEVGGFSDVIMVSEGLYAVFVLDEKELLSDEEVLDIGKSEFDSMKKDEFFNGKLDEYEEEASITFNEKAVNSVELKTIETDSDEETLE